MARAEEIEFLTRSIEHLASAKIQLAESKFGKNEENVTGITILINELIERTKEV